MREGDIQQGEDKHSGNPRGGGGRWFGKAMGCAGFSSAVEGQAPPRNAKLMRFALFLLPTLLVATSSYLYLHLQAAPFTPPVGYVFPREPVLTGEYRYEVLQGRRNHRTMVGNTEIVCSTFSYYAGTWAQSDGYSNCRRKEQLHGKHVEVYRVRVPQLDESAGSLVIKIVSDGRVYLDRSDAEIRDLWIRDTRYDVFSGPKLFIIALGCVFWLLSGRLINKFNEWMKK